MKFTEGVSIWQHRDACQLAVPLLLLLARGPKAQSTPSILTRLLAMHRGTSEHVWSKHAIVQANDGEKQEEKIEKLTFGKINSPCPFTLTITDVLWGCLYSLDAISVSSNTTPVTSLPEGCTAAGSCLPVAAVGNLLHECTKHHLLTCRSRGLT